MNKSPDHCTDLSFYDEQAIIGLSKRTGRPSSEILRDAETLAKYNLRSGQIARLTGLPEPTTSRITTASGYAFKTGREKKSTRELFRDPHLQAVSAAFIYCVRAMLPSKRSAIQGQHVIASIQSLYLRNPSAAHLVDWERMVNTAFLWQEGVLDLQQCSMCATFTILEAGRADQTNRVCVLCRLGVAVTQHGHGTSVVTPFRISNRRGFPTLAPRPTECRQRMRTIFSTEV